MRNFLLITYYWPPSGGVGVQRWLKLSKYLPEYGWRPIVLTPENPAFSIQDPELQQDVREDTKVFRIPIWEPNHMLQRKPTTQGANYGLAAEGNGPLGWLLNWVRGNLFIPDARRFWVKPATKYALSLIELNTIEAVVTTGPPHSMHLIGLALKKKTGLPWLADFRDLWSEWDVLDRLKITAPARQIHRRLERQVLRTADTVINATNGGSQALERLAKRPVYTVLNGVDLDTKHISTTTETPPTKFQVLYAGMLNAGRNPEVLWEALAYLCREDENFYKALEVKLVGTISDTVTPEQTFPELTNKIMRSTPIPHYQVQQMYGQAALLLLTVDKVETGKVYLPVKFFEYLAAQRPILYIGYPETQLGQMVREENVGCAVGFHDLEGVKNFLRQLFKEYVAGESLHRPTNYQKYSRQGQARQMSEYLNQLVEPAKPLN